MLQNRREGWTSPGIARLEHINGDKPYSTLWTRAHNTENAFIERFNKTYRDEVLDAYVFEAIEQVREVTDTWLSKYNEERPHDSLGRVPPLTFMPRPLPARESNFKLCP